MKQHTTFKYGIKDKLVVKAEKLMNEGNLYFPSDTKMRKIMKIIENNRLEIVCLEDQGKYIGSILRKI